MAYATVTVEQFGGLDFIRDPAEIGLNGATNHINVDLDRPGRIRSRDGTSAVTAAAANAQTAMAYYKDAASNEFVVTAEGGAPLLVPYSLPGGAAGATQAATVTSNNAFARFGDPANTRLYVAAGTLYRFDGAAWGAVGAAPISPTMAAVTANDNRLIISDGATLWWSDAGAPETFTAGNFVTLWPGDGERITGIVRWRDKVFVFKQSRFAVFTGTSTASNGAPVFNYYSVDAGRGSYAPGMAVAGEEGVYFMDASGVYVTTGDGPRYISHPLEPFESGTFAGTELVYHNRRLYVLVPISSATYVFDPLAGAWMLWAFGAGAACSVPVSSASQALHFGDVASKKVARFTEGAIADMGVAIPWSYTSGYGDVGSPARKVHVKTTVQGTGTITHQLLTIGGRAGDVVDPGAVMTLGIAGAIGEATRRRAARGSLFAHKLSGTTGGVTATAVTRLTSSVEMGGGDV